MRTDKQMATAAAEFAERWRGVGMNEAKANYFGPTCWRMSLV